MAQPWPAWKTTIDWATAWAKFGVSSRMMLADLPPSSRNSRFRVGAPFSMILRPTAVEPVKVTRSTRGSLVSISPAIAGSDEVTTLNTPGGKPASCASSPRTVAALGVFGAGLRIMVQPASRPAMTLPRLT